MLANVSLGLFASANVLLRRLAMDTVGFRFNMPVDLPQVV
jgi:hypothetical protein